VTVTFKSLYQLVQPPLTIETPRAIVNMRWTSYLRTHERHPNTAPASCAHAVSAWCLLLQYSPEAARRGGKHAITAAKGVNGVKSLGWKITEPGFDELVFGCES